MQTNNFPSEPEPFDFQAGPHPIRAINYLCDVMQEMADKIHSLEVRLERLELVDPTS